MSEISKEERTWAMVTHLSALSGFFTGGIGTIVGPLSVWLIKKEEMPFVDEQGNHRQRVRNGEQLGKNKSWRVTLVPSDDPIKVATARWLFDTYAKTDIGYRALANELNRRGVPSPAGGCWHYSSSSWGGASVLRAGVAFCVDVDVAMRCPR